MLEFLHNLYIVFFNLASYLFGLVIKQLMLYMYTYIFPLIDYI